MKGLIPLVLGIFGTFTFSWVGLTVIPNLQIGHLDPQMDEEGTDVYPAPQSGVSHKESDRPAYPSLGFQVRLCVENKDADDARRLNTALALQALLQQPRDFRLVSPRYLQVVKAKLGWLKQPDSIAPQPEMRPPREMSTEQENSLA